MLPLSPLSHPPQRTAPPSHPALRQPHFFYTPEQRNRARLYRELHYVFSHPGHDKLCRALDLNLIPGVNLTSADYKVYKDIYGQCPQCVQCKQKRKSMKPSSTAPATKIGQVLSLDLQGLPDKTIGGKTQSLTAVDELTGFMSCTGSASKHVPDLLVATIKLIALYRLNGHTVEHIHCDAESALVALKVPCSLMVPPNHCYSVPPQPNMPSAWNGIFRRTITDVLLSWQASRSSSLQTCICISEYIVLT